MGSFNKFKELREQLSDEDVINILAEYGVTKYDEDATKIIFPTCCHNADGGSPKLYYYKNNKMFLCYSGNNEGCGGMFDIFTLMQRMVVARGQSSISMKQAVEMCHLDGGNMSTEKRDFISIEDLRHMQELNNTYLPNIDDPTRFKIYDKDILRKFSFDYVGLMPWIQEGISIEALQKFNIKYDDYNKAIVIPNFDFDGNLIGVRARYFKEEDIAKGKYRPMYINGILHSHPTGRTFYGIYENKEAIRKKRTAVIFEGEKSVLLYGSIYGCDNNIALATLGQNISREHIKYLLKLGVSNVILAYDTDYEDRTQMISVEKDYVEKVRILTPYFKTSIIMDEDFLLPYKSSPIDGGKDVFEKLLATRRKV